MPLNFKPPLLNSACPWATTQDDLKRLYECPHTGAVTTRTCTLNGFNHDPVINQYAFFDSRTNAPLNDRSPLANSSINTLGYSPLPLEEYLRIIEVIVSESGAAARKPFIVSVSGTAEEVALCHGRISSAVTRTSIPMLMEVNLSCPNLDGPPPSFSDASLLEYLHAVQRAAQNGSSCSLAHVMVGIKTAPYTYRGQFSTVIDALLATIEGEQRCPVDFITATNTLGNSMVMSESSGPTSFAPIVASADGTGIGGLGGSAIHALSLGNVFTFRRLLDQHDKLRHIDIIGVGGIGDYAGCSRMSRVGAAAVALATSLGKEGIAVFEKIMNELVVMDKIS